MNPEKRIKTLQTKISTAQMKLRNEGVEYLRIKTDIHNACEEIRDMTVSQNRYEECLRNIDCLKKEACKAKGNITRYTNDIKQKERELKDTQSLYVKGII